MTQHRRPDGIDLTARSRARRRATQALYAWQVGGNSMKDVIEEFRHEQDMEIADLDYFEDLLRGVEKHCAELKPLIAGGTRNLEAIASKIEQMSRLWPDLPGLQQRRRKEAAIIRAANKEYGEGDLVRL